MDNMDKENKNQQSTQEERNPEHHPSASRSAKEAQELNKETIPSRNKSKEKAMAEHKKRRTEYVVDKITGNLIEDEHILEE